MRNETPAASTAPIALVTACVVAPSTAPTMTNTSAMLGTTTRGMRKARLAVAFQYAMTTVPTSAASRRTRAHVSSGATMAKKTDASSNERTSA